MDLKLLIIFVLFRSYSLLPVDTGNQRNQDKDNTASGTKNAWVKSTDFEESLSDLKQHSDQVLIRRTRELSDVVQAVSSDLVDSEVVGICQTIHCKTVAAEMLQTMDQSVSPCNDFYQFACGNWETHNPIPDMFGSYSSFVKLRQDVEGRLRALLEEPTTANESPSITKAKLMYQACSDEQTIENRGDRPLRDFVNSLGSWPILEGDTWDEDAFKLVDILVKGRKQGISTLMNLLVGTDYKTPTDRILKLDQARLCLPSRDYYFQERNNTILMTYEDFPYRVARKLGVPEARARSDAKDMIDFEIKLARLTLKREQRRDVNALYNKITIGELRRRIPGFDWLQFINGVLADVIDTPLTEDEPIILMAEQYIRNMINLVNNTSKRTVANYVMAYMIKDSIMDLSSDYRNIFNDYRKQIYGVQKDMPRWHTCVQLADRAMPTAVGRMFVDRYFDEGSKHEATEMIDRIGDVMKDLLEEALWMDEPTTIVAKEKADEMVHLIGYPDSILDDDKLAREYNSLNVDRFGHFENVHRSFSFKSKKYLHKLREPVNRTQWDTIRLADVNAYYDPSKNHLAFPAAVLQPPFYSKNNPNYMNYGGIGMIIGHEVTHGFDDIGRQFDGVGKLHDWWDQETINRFKEEKQCMLDQYGNYTLDSIGMKVNGLLTQGENIADNGGLKEAYRAYKNWVTDHGPEQRLPGLNLTQSQLFFLNFAQIWCSSARPETARNYILTDNHSPAIFRVIGTLSNMDSFSEAYNCPSGSSMNPVEKCSIW